jgi:hypothetical protein
MKKQFLTKSVAIIILAFLFFSCKKTGEGSFSKNNELLSETEKVVVPEIQTSFVAGKMSGKGDEYNTFYGPVVQMGDGHIRSWVNISRKGGEPLAIGIEITHKAFDHLPTDATNFAANTFILKLHQKAMAVTPFNHITINWEPEGHEPPGIYDVQHFDMHFYKISVADQMAITGVPGPAPAAGYLPASYVIQAATVPQMGTHWIDPSSPELHGSPFTHTFIYGSNNGHVHFLEPMITKAYLLSGSMVSRAIPQPMHFAPSNTYYPSTYKIWMNSDNNRHYVALTDMNWK